MLNFGVIIPKALKYESTEEEVSRHLLGKPREVGKPNGHCTCSGPKVRFRLKSFWLWLNLCEGYVCPAGSDSLRKGGMEKGKGLLQHYFYFYIFSSLLHSADVAHMFCAHLIGIRKFKSMCSGRQGEAEAEQTLLKDFSNDSVCSLMTCINLGYSKGRLNLPQKGERKRGWEPSYASNLTLHFRLLIRQKMSGA